MLSFFFFFVNYLLSLLFSLFYVIREFERFSRMRQVVLKDGGCDILRLGETHPRASPFLLAVKMTRHGLDKK